MVLASPLPALGLEPGAVGVVVQVLGQGVACVVESIGLDGRTIGLKTLEACHLRPITGQSSGPAPLGGA